MSIQRQALKTCWLANVSHHDGMSKTFEPWRKCFFSSPQVAKKQLVPAANPQHFRNIKILRQAQVVPWVKTRTSL